MAVKVKPKWFNSVYITVSQISQMVVGVTIMVLGFILPPGFAGECAISTENNVAGLIMYGSYLMLFVQGFNAKIVCSFSYGEPSGSFAAG